MANTFSPPNTKCKDCVFNKENTLDCETGARQHYYDLGVNIRLPPIVDGSPVGLELENFICPYFRDETWYPNGLGEESVDAVLDEEISWLPYIAVIVDHNKQNIYKTIERILDFDNHPLEIYVVLKADRPDAESVVELKQCFDKFLGKWHVFFELDNDSWQTIMKFYKEQRFILLVNGYPNVDNSWPRNTGRKIQNDLLKFPYAENDDNSMTLIHPYYINAFFFEYGKDWLTRLKEQTCSLKYKL